MIGKWHPERPREFWGKLNGFMGKDFALLVGNDSVALVGFVLSALSLLILTSLALSHFIVFCLVPLAVWALPAVLDWMLHSASPEGLLLFIVAVGGGAYAVRQRAPDVYGLVEILFGAITAALALKQFVRPTLPEPVATALFTLATALYVVVRGFDNFGRWAGSKEMENRWFGRVWAWFFKSRKERQKVAQQECVSGQQTTPGAEAGDAVPPGANSPTDIP